MLREPNLTDGIGVRIAPNIPCTPTKDVLIDRIQTSVTSAKQRKTTKTAQPKELIRIAKKIIEKSDNLDHYLPNYIGDLQSLMIHRVPLSQS